MGFLLEVYPRLKDCSQNSHNCFYLSRRVVTSQGFVHVSCSVTHLLRSEMLKKEDIIDTSSRILINPSYSPIHYTVPHPRGRDFAHSFVSTWPSITRRFVWLLKKTGRSFVA